MATNLVLDGVRAACAAPGACTITAVAMMMWLNAADAQQSSPAASSAARGAEPLEEVIVTGIRRSIAKSVDVKLESSSIVEAISAEDIGKLPDVSIADSISRLPGLATQRVDGRSQVVQIRGLSEQFVGTLLNGREQVSTGDSRGVEFDQYPAELINAVTVYKTADAGVVGAGLSGTVDLQTIRPLGLGERRMVFGASGEYNSLGDLSADGDSKGYRGTFSYVDQFADDTVGVAFGYARLDSPFQEEHQKQWWWANTSQWGAPNAGDNIAMQGAEGWIKSRGLTRDGLVGVLELRPNENFRSQINAYYSKFKQDEVMHGAMWNSNPWDLGGVGYSNIRTTAVPFGGQSYPVVSSGDLSNVGIVVRNDANKRDDDLYSADWSNSYTWDAWSLAFDLSYSKAKREQSQLETYAGYLDTQSISFDIPVYGPGFAEFTVPDLADPASIHLRDVAGWGHDGRREDSEQEDEIKAARLGLNRSYESSFLQNLSVGANFNRRSKDKHATVYFADLKNGGSPALVNPAHLMSPTALGFIGAGRILSYDPYALIDAGYYDVTVSPSKDDLRKNYSVTEDVDTYYAKLDFDIAATERVAFRGNVGVQYIRTDQSSTGLNVSDNPNGGDPLIGPQTQGTTYTDTLPSVNIVADFGDGWMVRLGLAKTLMRPPINYLAADSSASVGAIDRRWSGSGGNPELEPYRADALDISLEKYLADAAYVSVALFYKDLESYVYSHTFEDWDFSSYTNNTPNVEPVSAIGSFTTWHNGSGGYMRGVEGAATITGDLFTPVLAGFGIQLNASYTESSIDPDGPGGSSTDTVPGLSKIVANGTIYYERNGFSARLSERYRDDYRGEYAYLFGQRQYRYTLPERQLDLQLSYDFQENTTLHGLSLLAQVYNLNDSPFRTTVTNSTDPARLSFPEEYTEYGRQYLLGFRYSL
jgi:iron complex outermembrane recepter protein